MKACDSLSLPLLPGIPAKPLAAYPGFGTSEGEWEIKVYNSTSDTISLENVFLPFTTSCLTSTCPNTPPGLAIMVQWKKIFTTNGNADHGHLRDEMRRRKSLLNLNYPFLYFSDELLNILS